MKVRITCSKCRKTFLCSTNNTKIQNPIITCECPECGETYIGNVSAFAFKQAELLGKKGLINRAAFMITLMQNVAFKSNDDKHGVHIRKHTNKKWNTQHTK